MTDHILLCAIEHLREATYAYKWLQHGNNTHDPFPSLIQQIELFFTGHDYDYDETTVDSIIDSVHRDVGVDPRITKLYTAGKTSEYELYNDPSGYLFIRSYIEMIITIAQYMGM